MEKQVCGLPAFSYITNVTIMIIDTKLMKAGQDLADFMLDRATLLITEEGELKYPMFGMVTAAGEKRIFIIPFIEHKDHPPVELQKDLTAAVIKNMAKEENALRYIFIAEAWMGETPADTPEDKMVAPRNDPNARSGLIFVDETPNAMKVRSFYIQKGLNRTDLIEKELVTKSAKGRFIGIVYNSENIHINPN